MNTEVYAAVAAITTAVAGIVTTLVKNSRDIAHLKRYACFRFPCPDRLTTDALQSKSRQEK